jgi:hypothetical protein
LLRNAQALARMRDGKVSPRCTVFVDFPHASQWTDSNGTAHSSIYVTPATLSVCVPATATEADCALNHLPAFSRHGAAYAARVSSPATSTATL